LYGIYVCMGYMYVWGIEEQCNWNYSAAMIPRTEDCKPEYWKTMLSNANEIYCAGKKYATLNYINFHFLAFGVSLLKLIINSMLAFTLWYLYTKIKRWEQTIERRQKYFYCYDLFREESLEETVIKLRENWERELVLERIDLVSNCVLTLINQNACKENFLNWWLTVQLGIVFLSYF